MVAESSSVGNLKKSDKTVQISLISSLFAGVISRVITYPLDTLKAKIQIQKNKNSGLINTCKNTILSEGIKGLYKGLPVAVLGSIPGSLLYFGGYEFAKKHLLMYKNFSNSEFLMYFVSGMIAEIVCCTIYVPVDVIKERRQVQTSLKSYNYKSDLDAFYQIITKEGIKGLYKAYGATVLSFGPLSALYFMLYEYFKGYFVRNDAKTYLQRIKKEDIELLKKSKLDISFTQSLICSSAAGCIASVITNPLDLVKLRMQVHRAGNSYNRESSVPLYRNIFHGLYVVLKTEGLSGWYRGSLVRALFHTPTYAISMTLIELIKPHMRKIMKQEI